MSKKRFLKYELALWFGFAATAFPQSPGTDHVAVQFSDSSHPGTVKVNLLAGSISVKGYPGKEVVVDAEGRDQGARIARGRPAPTESAGMRRIPNLSTGLNVEEENNVISIGTGILNRPVDITLQVPSRTDLKLNTVNDGNISVEQVQGEIEINNINGAVTLTDISGSVVAHSLNRDVKVRFTGIDPKKPMSFSSLNGNIDVALPPDTKANVSMKSDNGEIYSDFDIKIDSKAAQPVTEDARGKGGKYRVRMDRTTKGTINGGGPEIQFKTFNGNIYIRKAVLSK
jgi:hypothetical protein